MAKRVLLFGATGTAGAGALRGLRRAGHEVTVYLRKRSNSLPVDIDQVIGQIDQPRDLTRAMAAGFDAVVSCLASRSGAPEDAWAVDHNAHQVILQTAIAHHVPQFVLLSAICVQKPLLAFQEAKLAFETSLQAAPLTWSIVRPTAFFKSLSGQARRIQAGKPFLLFGNGALTACKPISDDDLGDFIAGCLTDPKRAGQILPIGGPGPAITPRQQGEMLFDAFGVTPSFRQVPVALMDAVIGITGTLGRVIPKMAQKSQLARIGRYYATESMLVWDPAAQRYDADATPTYGSDTLAHFYRDLAEGKAQVDLGQHAVL